MTKEAIEARNQYKREWAKAHPKKQKEYQERYWEKKAEELREKAKNITVTIE